MERFTWLMGVAALASMTMAGFSSHAAAEPSLGVCGMTSNLALRSCQTAARGDNTLATAKCLNLVDSKAGKDCRRQAAADLKDALQSCQDQDDVRDTACERLGPGPYDPVIDPANFVATIDNPYFPLTPGTTFIYESHLGQDVNRDEFAVTHNTRVIRGVTCIEVHDSVFTNGTLVEDTLDWFAQDVAGNVWYFGENTHELADGLITTIDGTFMAGVDGAKPGIIMEATSAIGDFYRQEFDLNNAEDYAEVVSLTDSVTVPAGSYTNCLKTEETTPLEPDNLEHKFYAKNVGNILTVDETTGERVELIQITTGN